MKKLAFTLLMGFVLGPVFAQNSIYWIKKGNGFWGVAANWEVPGVVPVNRIPNSLDTVFIQHDSVVIPNGLAAYARRIELGVIDSSGTGLAVLNGGTLVVKDYNAGFGSKAGIEIINASLLNLGNLNVINCYPGILVDATAVFENQNILTIDSAIQSGITNVNLLENGENGIITISNLSGISSSPSGIANSDTIINDGIISINNAGYGINNGGVILNNGDLSINECYDYGIEGGSFFNVGLLKISNTGIGLDVMTMINSDTIRIDSIEQGGVINTFDNLGFIEINEVELGGLKIVDNLNNESAGFIYIHNSIFASADGIHNTGNIDNLGTIKIESFIFSDNKGLKNNGSITNFGDLLISDCREGIHNSSSISNLGGQIKISVCPFGWTNNSSSIILNDLNGLLEISNCTEGFLFYSGSSIDNKSGSTIKTSMMFSSPMDCKLGSILTNEGIMEIEN